MRKGHAFPAIHAIIESISYLVSIHCAGTSPARLTTAKLRYINDLALLLGSKMCVFLYDTCA